ncbi:hypothetical protein JR316_0007902 [Psilocybe cubensis]|uniref:Uncharacterized protein n=1 Tax=Psilocybe cubensis TaxID=181762 RepID=A0ACB8GUA4_PSICU|nr:hypothetical protein JR316_0007902 [Psilocybe cubensis]KAH9479313.1 hypothetical protein JR316_0007902 [Psilocybe cubensis]
MSALFRSSDGVEFDLHRTLLGANTGAFPGPELETDGQVVELSEPAKVLQICFDFIYPKRHPDLEDITSFELLASVAEAVGKYEIFAAINTCNTRLRSFIPQYATEIFVYAIKHDHPKLMNDAVPYLARSPFVPVLKQIPPAYMVPWSRYHDAWLAVFREATKHIKKILPSSTNQCHVATSSSFSSSFSMLPDQICNACRCSLFTWVSNLEEINNVTVLNTALRNASEKNIGLPCCAVSDGSRGMQLGSPQLISFAPSKPDHAKCTHIVKLAKICQDLIQAIPSFDAFIGQN